MLIKSVFVHISREMLVCNRRLGEDSHFSPLVDMEVINFIHMVIVDKLMERKN